MARDSVLRQYSGASGCFPLGPLTYRSRFIPCIFGVPLILAGSSWLADSLAPFLLLLYESVIHTWMSPLRKGELLFMFWLLIVGTKPKLAAEPPAGT